MHESEDEEATEFLAMRPPSVASGLGGEPASSPSSLRARGRAVPLEGEASTPGIAAPERKSREAPVSEKLVEKDERPAPLPSRTPRPLPERQTNVKSETQTGTNSAKSAPRITRIFAEDNHRILPDEGRTDPGDDDEVTDPPLPRPVKPRPLPGSADKIASEDGRFTAEASAAQSRGVPGRPAPRPATVVAHGAPGEEDRRPKTARTEVASSETLEAEPPDGTLIVEVPDGAIVFVNGIERGVGPSLKVNEIDRYAKHAVRIHAPGYAPWSGSVCLEGRTAAKIRPGLKAKK